MCAGAIFVVTSSLATHEKEAVDKGNCMWKALGWQLASWVWGCQGTSVETERARGEGAAEEVGEAGRSRK